MADGITGATAARAAGHADRKITSIRLRRLLEAQGFKCALTGRDLNPDNASLDHIQPLSRGGANIMENVQIVLCAVNQAKGTMTNDEFIAICRAVADWTLRNE